MFLPSQIRIWYQGSREYVSRDSLEQTDEYDPLLKLVQKRVRPPEFGQCKSKAKYMFSEDGNALLSIEVDTVSVNTKLGLLQDLIQLGSWDGPERFDEGNWNSAPRLASIYGQP